jgi:hypothetical protein
MPRRRPSIPRCANAPRPPFRPPAPRRLAPLHGRRRPPSPRKQRRQRTLLNPSAAARRGRLATRSRSAQNSDSAYPRGQPGPTVAAGERRQLTKTPVGLAPPRAPRPSLRRAHRAWPHTQRRAPGRALPRAAVAKKDRISVAGKHRIHMTETNRFHATVYSVTARAVRAARLVERTAARRVTRKPAPCPRPAAPRPRPKRGRKSGRSSAAVMQAGGIHVGYSGVAKLWLLSHSRGGLIIRTIPAPYSRSSCLCLYLALRFRFGFFLVLHLIG